MNTNEEMKKLYKELSGYAQIDDILDAIDKIADEYNKSNQEHTQECDGDCENCKYGTEQMDDYAYEYGYRDIPQDLEEFMDGKYDAVEKYDAVDHPAHYAGKIEVIDFIEDKHLNYNLGNCVKYIARAGKKCEAGMSLLEKTIEDLSKARWYLDREINKLKQRHDF